MLAKLGVGVDVWRLADEDEPTNLQTQGENLSLLYLSITNPAAWLLTTS